MASLQIGFIAFTFLAPPLLWLLSRRIRSQRLVTGICWAFAVALLGSYVATIVIKAIRGPAFAADHALPMHLCDWAAFVTLLALVKRSPMAFELAYCWGLAGTAQALFTPAIEISMDPRVITFLLVHSLIPASVFWLMFEGRMRPRRGAYLRVMLWSEVYLVAALITNSLVDGNYGFLAERPDQPSLLDHFSDTRWIHVLQINGTAAIAFGLLMLPWWIANRRREARGRTAMARGIADA